MGLYGIVTRYNPPICDHKAYGRLHLFYQPTTTCGIFHDRLMYIGVTVVTPGAAIRIVPRIPTSGKCLV